VRKFVVPVIVVAAFASAWLTYALVHHGSDKGPTPGVVAMNRPLPLLRGDQIYGGSGPFVPPMFQGQALVVNFWNPYCTPCRAEAGLLDLALGQVHLMHAQVRFVGVLYSNANFPHDVAAARRFARLYGERYPTIDDPGGVISRRFGIRGIPTTMIADANGRLRYEILGKLKPNELDRLIRRVLRR
jgi:thiol-disulfide isomerase/thioredoxin